MTIRRQERHVWCRPVMGKMQTHKGDGVVLNGPLGPASSAFPTREQLQRGVLLGTIIHALSTLPADTFYDDYKWDGHVLRLNDYNETRGCIAFTPTRVVGAFFFAESDRSPFGGDTIPPYNAEAYFAVAPPEVLAIARRDVLPLLEDWLGEPAIAMAAYLHDTTNQLDPAYYAPVITAAFWSEGDALTAGEPWPDVYHHGAHILRLELSGPERALAELENEMQLRPEQVAFVRRLYERRLATTELPMRLTAEEYAQLTAHGTAQLEPVGKLLAAVGIVLP